MATMASLSEWVKKNLSHVDLSKAKEDSNLEDYFEVPDLQEIINQLGNDPDKSWSDVSTFRDLLSIISI